MNYDVNFAINVAAFTVRLGIDRSLTDAYEGGCVELYDDIGRWAAVVTEEEYYLAHALDFHEDSWAGVFCYEVTEEVAAGCRAILLDGRTPEDTYVRAKTRTLIEKYTERNLEAVFETYQKLSYGEAV